MADLTAVPQWVGTAVLGALLAVLGYIAKQLAEWGASLRAAERARRARLAELLALIRAGDVAFWIQGENRDRLVHLLQTRNPSLQPGGQGFDHLLASAYPSMSPDERELHAVIRGITVHTLRPLNDGILAWLKVDTDFRVRPPGQGPREQLARYLTDLEAHLLLWRAKYEAWIPDHPERALVYLADEKRHGIGFPDGGTALVTTLLHGRKWIGA
jgi:hypothetical protein